MLADIQNHVVLYIYTESGVTRFTRMHEKMTKHTYRHG